MAFDSVRPGAAQLDAQDRAPSEVQRVAEFLEERIAWLKYEANHGGDWQALGAMEKECAVIQRAIRTGRYKEDGRPSWLINAIPVHRLGDGAHEASTLGNSGRPTE